MSNLAAVMGITILVAVADFAKTKYLIFNDLLFLMK